jgi:NADH:ubiquinone oxidoreductase subunit F (NADH-binding)
VTSLMRGSVSFASSDTEHAVGLATQSLAEHRAQWGARLTSSAGLLDAVDAAHVRGRGGSYFPAAIKWRSAIAGQVDTVVANAAESEPASVKDAALWQSSPHLVIDGLQSTAEAVGARRAVVWLHSGAHATAAAIARARAERVAEGETGVEIEVVTAPDRYLSGESSAIIRALRGGPAVPGFSPRGQRSWGTGPAVLVHNTETLARVATLERAGDAAVDSTLVTVSYAANRTVSEVRTDVTFREHLDSIDEPSALLLGGYGGQWVDWNTIADLPIDEHELALRGIRLGAGVVVPLPRDVCGIAETSRIVNWMAGQSARQCGPCLYGLAAIDSDLRAIVGLRGARKAARELRTHLGLVAGRGACSHPDGVVGLVISALETFHDEVESHVHGKCSAGYHRGVVPLPEEHHR